ncbi:MAG: DEAD/DEAH box helicase [Proteobacteria bacterium]|nr:DEAD/DEAH box helicase [Pseudomonadota bacterium]NDG19002.1 DEAD/DEAH box helicase [Betaproteobacteria bacterium]
MRHLWQHQVEAIQYALDRHSVLWHVGMGCGKTRCALEVIRALLEQHPNGRFLVGCPKAVIAAWLKQSTMWLPQVRILALDKGTAREKDARVKAALADTSPLIIVGNYESIRLLPALLKVRFAALVWDEVHRLKSISGAASRWAAAMCKLSPQAKKIGMSGTMLPHSPLDAIGVWRSVEAPECPTFGVSKTMFVAKFFQPHPHIRGAVLGLRRDKEAEFAKLVKETTFHRRSEDVLDLPPLMMQDITVELSTAEAKLYREVEREFIAVCERGTITPKNAMESVLRLQQICGGYAKFDDAVDAAKIDDIPSKQSMLADRLEELDRDEQAVVFCRFRTDIDSAKAAAESIGRTVAELSGRMNELAEWQAGRRSVLVTQIQSGGVGVDMSMCAYGIFYSLGYGLGEYQQAIARLHRPGQTKTTHFYHLVSLLPGGRKTIDGRIYQLLSERKEVIDGIVNEFKQGHAGQHARAD